MSVTSVSIVIPLMGPSAELPSTLETLERYLQATGFAFDIRVLDRRDGDGYGAIIRRGAAEASGSVIIVVDHDLPYPVSAIGDAVTLIESGAAEVVFARRNACRDSATSNHAKSARPGTPVSAATVTGVSCDAAVFGSLPFRCTRSAYARLKPPTPTPRTGCALAIRIPLATRLALPLDALLSPEVV